MNKYQLVEKVGDGTYGVVWMAYNINNNEKVAVKKLKNKCKSTNEVYESCEVKFLKNIKNHNNIIKLIEVCIETNLDVYIIFEYCDMNLYEYIEKHKAKGKTISEYTCKNIIFQIALGLEYMHSNGYFHRDLKPENILVKLNNNNNNNNNNTNYDNVIIKIADFGLVKEIQNNKSNNFIHYTNNKLNNNSQLLTDYVCTRWYRAPECVLKSTNYNQLVDIFALGAIFGEVINLKALFPGESEFDQLNKIVNVLGTPSYNSWPEGYKLIGDLKMKFPQLKGSGLRYKINNISDEGISIITKMLTWNNKNRITAKQIIESSYFSDFYNKINPYKNSSNINNIGSDMNDNLFNNKNKLENNSNVLNKEIGNINDLYQYGIVPNNDINSNNFYNNNNQYSNQYSNQFNNPSIKINNNNNNHSKDKIYNTYGNNNNNTKNVKNTYENYYNKINQDLYSNSSISMPSTSNTNTNSYSTNSNYTNSTNNNNMQYYYGNNNNNNNMNNYTNNNSNNNNKYINHNNNNRNGNSKNKNYNNNISKKYNDYVDNYENNYLNIYNNNTNNINNINSINNQYNSNKINNNNQYNNFYKNSYSNNPLYNNMNMYV